MAYTDKLGGMSRTLSGLDSLRSQMISTYGTDMAVALRQAQRVADVAIATLKGQDVQPGDINAYTQALADDDYFTNAWIPLAQQTGDSMSMALGLTNQWSVTNTIENGYSNIGDYLQDHVPTLPEVGAGVGLFAVIAVAVAVIVVFK